MSGIDLDDKLVESATKIAITRNERGDTVYGASTTGVACLYRDISSLQHQQNQEDVKIDGLLWFKASEDVQKGDIYYHPSEGYLRIIKVIKAKDLLRANLVRFIKCEVVKQRQLS